VVFALDTFAPLMIGGFLVSGTAIFKAKTPFSFFATASARIRQLILDTNSLHANAGKGLASSRLFREQTITGRLKEQIDLCGQRDIVSAQ
jgi:hypothetical protein